MTARPDFSIETTFSGIIAGVDEAGRGPLAGPVVAAAVVLDITRVPDGIHDSKKLAREQRESLFDLIMACAHVGVGVATVGEIDRINILQASMLAMKRAVKALAVSPDIALVDGNYPPKRMPCKVHTVVKGDSKSLSIASASIIAKVTRDRIMCELACKHPFYGWDSNAGYGTEKHLEGIASYGITRHHRKSFAPVRDHVAPKGLFDE